MRIPSSWRDPSRSRTRTCCTFRILHRIPLANSLEWWARSRAPFLAAPPSTEHPSEVDLHFDLRNRPPRNHAPSWGCGGRAPVLAAPRASLSSLSSNCPCRPRTSRLQLLPLGMVAIAPLRPRTAILGCALPLIDGGTSD